MEKVGLTKKEIQIIELGASISSGCTPCTKYHVKKCKEAGISDNDINSVIKQSEQIISNVADIMISIAHKSVSTRNKKEFKFRLDSITRNNVLLGITISYILSSASLFEEFLKLGDNLDIKRNEITRIIEISKFIMDKARAHVDMIAEKIGVEKPIKENYDCCNTCEC